MKKPVKVILTIAILIIALLVGFFVFGSSASSSSSCNTVKKPVIYVYNYTDDPSVVVSVTDKTDGKLGLEYPRSSKGTWLIKADENGNITYKNRQYNYLYWEDEAVLDVDFSKGFCVPGKETASFLEGALDELGLTDAEADDFITYWLPQLVENDYNLITFNPPEYEKQYKLASAPKADNIIRVFMAYTPSKEYVDVEPQRLGAYNTYDRTGITLVEWGGAEITK